MSTTTSAPTVMMFSKVVVADPAALYPFYRDVFGLEVRHEVREHVGTEDEVYEFILRATDEGASLVLISFPNKELPPVGEAIFGARVADLRAVVEAAPKAGGSIDADIVSMPQHGVDVAFIKDPEGHLFEVVQAHPR